MTASIYKDQDVSQKPTSAALPKVNVRPAAVPVSYAKAPVPQAGKPESSDAGSSVKAALAPELRVRRKDWDIRFAIGLIVVVVLVNVTLTLLLSGESAPDTEQATIRMEPLPPKAEQHQTDNDRSANVYISSEEKRLLLRHLYAPDVRAPHPRNNEQGTYRSLSRSEDRSLSIINTGPSAGQ